MSIRQNGKVIAGATQYHPDLFDWKWADHQLDDVQWLRADTFSWQSGAVYESAYQHLVDDIDGQTAQTESIAGITISFYLANDGHKVCPASEESNVTAIYNATGVAWYYIIDIPNKRFKLPRAKHAKYSDTLGVVGTGMTLGLISSAGGTKYTYGLATNQPNMSTTYLTPQPNAYGKDEGSTYTQNTTNWARSVGVTDDPTKSGIIAQQTQDTDQYKYLYFYVGNFTQTALENTAGLNASLFNNKADIDLTNAVSNASSVAKETIVGWGLPDYSAGVSVSVATLLAGYVAPSNGVLFTSSGWLTIKVNNNNLPSVNNFNFSGNAVSLQQICFPLTKGDTIIGTGGYVNDTAIFFPFKGA